MRYPTFMLAIYLGLAIVAQAQELHLWGEELGPVFDVLRQGGQSAFVELSGPCNLPSLPRVPQFNTAFHTNRSALEQLQEVVRGSGMRVSRSSDGIFLVRPKSVPRDILSIRIAHVVFEDYSGADVYSANAALEAVLKAPEIVHYAMNHDISLGPRARGGSWIIRAKRLPPSGPHLSGSMDNVTLRQAIQRIFQTFPGEILVYWDCPKPLKRRISAAAQNVEPQRSNSCPSDLDGTAGSIRPEGLPDPFCLPPSTFINPPPTDYVLGEPPSQRRFLFRFFSRKKFGDRPIITSG
jgi:hypothetical protein